MQGVARPIDELTGRLVAALCAVEQERRGGPSALTDGEPGTAAAAGKPIGRPPLLTAEILGAVEGALATGQSRAAAARAGGVTPRTLQRWAARGSEVHAAGVARSEYERLCAVLHTRLAALNGGPEGPVNPRGEDIEEAAVSPVEPAAAPVITIGRAPRRGLMALVRRAFHASSRAEAS